VVLVGAGAFGWLWFQSHQISELAEGRLAEAEPLIKRSLAVLEKARDPESLSSCSESSILLQFPQQPHARRMHKAQPRLEVQLQLMG